MSEAQKTWLQTWMERHAMRWNASPDGYIERDPAPVLPPPENESRRVILELEREINEGRQLSAKERL